ncbi:ATP-grasp domain-containing protein [Catenulispora pinisilvae]|uniref:ATP-grasp domain-containing protein n=1 Tax=Catenulispora pinisilvae TaxID=2705253 RepID=UPI001891C213|nr:ATP-grasp domain-containing protein [Catenulispora pinisilvae]
MADPALAAPEDRPFVIVVSSLGALFREPFHQALAPHYRVWLFVGGAGRDSAVTWQKPYIVGSTHVDTLDAEAMLGAARELHERLRAEHGRGIEGVLSYDESRIIDTAALAEGLGLPTSGAEAVARCRDKHATRQALDAAGVPQARSIAVGSAQDAVRAATGLGFPVVVKPRNLAASFGVVRVDRAEDIAAAFHAAAGIELAEEKAKYEESVLVEEYLDGPEISVETACLDGRAAVLAVARKQLGFAPAFEEVGHVVDAADPLRTDADLAALVAAAHRAVGFHTGVTHTELRRTAAGYKVVEINARLAGGHIPLLALLAGGIDVNRIAADVACGREPELTDSARRVAAIRFYYPEQDGVLACVDIDRDALPAAIEQAQVLVDPMTEVKLPPRGVAWLSRVAHAIAVADTADECVSALDAAQKAITMEPSTGEPSIEAAR